MPTVRVEERRVRRADAPDTLFFPNMDSCIGILCVFPDGHRLAVHPVSDPSPKEEGKPFAQLKVQCLVERTKVSSLIVLGNADCWGLTIQSLITMAGRLPQPKGVTLAGYQRLLKQKSILDKSISRWDPPRSQA